MRMSPLTGQERKRNMEKEKNTYSMCTGIPREGYGLRAATGVTTACVFDTAETARIMGRYFEQMDLSPYHLCNVMDDILYILRSLGLRQAFEPVTAAMLNEAARRQQIEDFPPCHGPAGETQKAGIVQ